MRFIIATLLAACLFFTPQAFAENDNISDAEMDELVVIDIKVTDDALILEMQLGDALSFPKKANVFNKAGGQGCKISFISSKEFCSFFNVRSVALIMTVLETGNPDEMECVIYRDLKEDGLFFSTTRRATFRKIVTGVNLDLTTKPEVQINEDDTKQGAIVFKVLPPSSQETPEEDAPAVLSQDL